MEIPPSFLRISEQLYHLAQHPIYPQALLGQSWILEEEQGKVLGLGQFEGEGFCGF